jgi:enoyl-CoA hydratase/carnithine racemase
MAMATLERDGTAWLLELSSPLDLGALSNALDEVERELASGVVVRARGEGALESDLDALRASPGAWGTALQAQLSRLARLPSIAALHGRARGAGACLALACRGLAMSPLAVLEWPEAAQGLVPMGGASWRLPRRMGLVAALPHLVGAPLGREGAVRSRLALDLGPTGDPDALAREAIAALARLPSRPPRPRQALGLAIAQALRPFRGTIFRAAERHLPEPLRGQPAPIAALRCASVGIEQGPAAADAFAISATEELCRRARR